MNKATQLMVLGASPLNPASLFRAGELGTWFDPSDLASMYQESNGLTQVTAAGQLVGQVLDKRYALARNQELVTDPGFGTPAAWTAGTGWAVTGGKLVATGALSSTSTFTTVGFLTATRTYEASITCDAVTGGGWTIIQEGGTSYLGNKTTTGTFRGILTATAGGGVYVWANSTLTATFDNISVREIPGSHAAQSTAGSRPTLTAGGVLNFSSGTKSLVITFPSALGSSCTVARAVAGVGASILTGQTIGGTYTDTTDHCGLVIINRALTPSETLRLTRYLNRKAGV